MSEVLSVFLIPLALTIFVECACALIVGLRSAYDLAVVALINVITNPVLVWSVVTLDLLLARGLSRWPGVLVLEALVVLAEWRLLGWALGNRVQRPFLLAAGFNAASFGAGLVLIP